MSLLPFNDSFSIILTILELLDDGGLEGKFKETILSLREDQMRGFIRQVKQWVACYCAVFCTDSVLQLSNKWNTNARHCLIAQGVLSILLRSQPLEKLMALDDIRLLLEGFIPYTERHFQRISRLQQVWWCI